MNRFDENFRNELRNTVRDLEGGTGAEIVVALSPKVGRYFFSHVVFGTICAFTLLTVLMFIPQEIWYVKIYYETLIAFVLGFILLYAISPLKRLIQGKKYMKERVQDRAKAMFHNARMHQTNHHTGVLIFVSFFEREVVIVADDGAESMVPAADWLSIRERFEKAFSAQHPPDAILSAIRESAATFSKYIPRRDDDVNELPDELWVH